jgi:hypothetical protein
MCTRTSFVEPGDRAGVGDEVVFQGDHCNLVRGLVADRADSPLSHVTRYRVVDSWSESSDPDAGKWVGDSRLYMIHPLRQRGAVQPLIRGHRNAWSAQEGQLPSARESNR